MEDSVHFYREVLGADVIFESPHFTLIKLGTAEIALHPPLTNNPGAVLGFQVPDLDEAILSLAETGYAVGEIHEIPNGRLVSLTDPNGVLLQLVERATTVPA